MQATRQPALRSSICNRDTNKLTKGLTEPMRTSWTRSQHPTDAVNADLLWDEDDLLKRRIAEARVDAHRIGTSTKKSVDSDAALLVAGEREKIAAALAALEEAASGEDPRRMQLRIDDLDAATKDFAERRMNRAIAKAIEGQRLDTVERTVEHAKGIELAHGSPLPPARQ